jgi:hypothetical protein
VDPTMDTAVTILRRFSSRLSHIHLSSLRLSITYR